MPKASIIIVTHNRPRLLLRAIESLRHAGTDVEIVVVDNASSDETAGVCRSLPEIKYIRIDRHQALGSARNVGLAASEGEYVGFLDDDDARLASSIDLQLEILEREPNAGFVYGQAIISDPDGRQLRSYPRDCAQADVFWKLLERNFIPSGSVIYRRRCFSAVGLFDQIPALADWDLCLRIAELYPVVALNAPVMIWRQSTPLSGQVTSDAARVVSLSVAQFRNWMKLPRAAAASRGKARATWRAFSENMAEHLIYESARALRFGDLRQTTKNLTVICRLHWLATLRIARKRADKLPDAFRSIWKRTIPNPKIENQVSK